jgi:hypothetical protein
MNSARMTSESINKRSAILLIFISLIFCFFSFGFISPIYTLKITNRLNIPITVHPTAIRQSGTIYNGPSGQDIYILPGETGVIPFYDTSKYIVSCNSTGYGFVARDPDGTTVYDHFFSYNELEKMDFQLVIS